MIATEVTERPILFNGEMVRAILDGRKTQTRRVVMRNASGRVQRGGRQWHIEDPNAVLACPYGQPGDRLWVRETWAAGSRFDDVSPSEIDPGVFVHYTADHPGDLHIMGMGRGRWRPSIHMPRWASRITLEVTDVRVERVQDITEEDARAEGIEPEEIVGYTTRGRAAWPRFTELWDSINAARGYGWDANPWVWVVGFRRLP